ncbi:MAG: hypothetical protein AMS27_03615 [Bacteroides sp. SM23_62_1]|nr:MAG: hypothetical protein AMS27_03615 [Bacteroides sp. SM23_62_1]
MINDILIKELSVKKLDSARNIQTQFDKVAGKLLNGYELVVSRKAYRLFEIEFYYHSAIHPDPFVHKHLQQLTKGRWYFHKKGAIYRPGIYRGVDLTFGDEDSKNFGGILIRGIVNHEDLTDYVYGPAKCVDHFRELMSQSVEGTDDRAAMKEKCPQLYLAEHEWTEERVISGPRVGLKIRPDEPLSEMFRYVHYRYIIYPRLPHKGKEALIAPGLLMKGWKKEEVNRVFGYRILR